MIPLRPIVGFLALAVLARGADEFFDRLEDALTFSAPDTRLRARVSGSFEFEWYAVQLPAPGLLSTVDGRLTAPRLNVFLDAQLGAGVYFFSQARGDRGFDPGEEGLQMRLDEYALRYTPGGDRRLNVQVGKFHRGRQLGGTPRCVGESFHHRATALRTPHRSLGFRTGAHEHGAAPVVARPAGVARRDHRGRKTAAAADHLGAELCLGDRGIGRSWTGALCR